MTTATAGASRHRRAVSGRGVFVLDASILVALLAASSAPTPLYPAYQEQWNLSALTVTLVFSAYALALLGALLVTGRLSDHVGRRPVLVGALALEAIAMALFAGADGVVPLVSARIVQGLATGMATSAAGAALLDLDPAGRRGAALANSVSPVLGMAVGVLTATALVRFAPHPMVTVYVLLAAVFLAQAAAVARTPETARRRAGALRSLLPRLALPTTARRVLLVAGPGIIAVWALGGFYSSLGPALTHTLAPQAPQATGGLLFFALTASAAAATWLSRPALPTTAAALGCCLLVPASGLSLLALHTHSLTALFAGSALAGFGFGAVSQGVLRLVLHSPAPHLRGGVLASYYVLSYLSMSLPAIAAGILTDSLDLQVTARLYASSVAVLAIVAAGALWTRRRVLLAAEASST
ncbi:MFS transporter [Streptomyces sp. NPDC004980]